MSNQENFFCFCTLAIGSKYRVLAKELAGDLDRYSSGSKLLIYTDKPEEFTEKNVLAFQHRQQGILHCYHDKRFVMQKALSMFPIAIHIDADTRLLDRVPDRIEVTPGIYGPYENMIEHIRKNRPQHMELIKNIANKLDIEWENANWIGESLFIVVRDEGREKDFFDQWGIIGSYLELKGMYSGSGNAMGLAAAKVGWTVSKSDIWKELNKISNHFDASERENKTTFWDNWKRRLGYHYRLNKARIAALKKFEFYYR